MLFLEKRPYSRYACNINECRPLNVALTAAYYLPCSLIRPQFTNHIIERDSRIHGLSRTSRHYME